MTLLPDQRGEFLRSRISLPVYVGSEVVYMDHSGGLSTATEPDYRNVDRTRRQLAEENAT
jgi:hypothetical protein